MGTGMRQPLRLIPGAWAVAAALVSASSVFAQATPVVSVEASRNFITEGEAARFQVEAPLRRFGEPLIVNLYVSGSGDFGVREGPATLTISGLSNEATYMLQTQADSVSEPFGSVTVTVLAGDGYTVGSSGEATTVICDDDTLAPPADDDDDDDDGNEPDDDDNDPDSSDPEDAESPLADFVHNANCADGLCYARTGEAIVFEDTSTGGAAARRNWDFGYDTWTRWSARRVRHAWTEPGFYEVSLSVENDAGESGHSQMFLVQASDPAGTCLPDDETLCLLDSRYSVRASWWTADGETGSASVVHAGTDETGLFWFFEPSNWEVLIKVLDGTGLNAHVWVYGASTTDVGYVISVTDTVTRATREYRNEPGHAAPAITDAAAFRVGPSIDSSRARTQGLTPAELPVTGACQANSETLCLQDGRFELTVDWSTLAGERGAGRTARPRTEDSGLFWYFGPLNWEMLVKVVDGTPMNGHFWLCVASATDVGFDLTVRDTVTGMVKSYTKEAGAPARAIMDVGAFPDTVEP